MVRDGFSAPWFAKSGVQKPREKLPLSLTECSGKEEKKSTGKEGEEGVGVRRLQHTLLRA
jgi:hypothetical protein